MHNLNFSALEVHLSRVLGAMAEAAKDKLKENLSGGGSGVQYPNQPNASSAPGEYPAEQSGSLLSSVGTRRDGDGWTFGVYNPPGYAAALEFKAPLSGGRPFLEPTMTDPETHQAMLEAALNAS